MSIVYLIQHLCFSNSVFTSLLNCFAEKNKINLLSLELLFTEMHYLTRTHLSHCYSQKHLTRKTYGYFKCLGNKINPVLMWLVFLLQLN